MIFAFAIVSVVIVILVGNENSYNYNSLPSNVLDTRGVNMSALDMETSANQTISQDPGSQSGVQAAPAVKKYEERYPFYTYQDPNEAAFTIEIPDGWQIMNGSGLIRPYIDAGVLVAAYSQENQEFIFKSPVAIYAVPNDILDFTGFTEGSYYGPGGIATPMMVKKYTTAKKYLEEYLSQLTVDTEVIETVDRPDLVSDNPDPLVTEQSAAEITYISDSGSYQLKNKVIAYTYLIETGGMGIWATSMFGYTSPESSFDETEYLVLKSAESFKVNANWAKREAQEVNKRLGIISSTQESISNSISSAFEYRSDTMDRINDDWSKAILGIEEVYDPDTEEMYVVDSGARYYWIDNRNNIYGTDTYENPFPLEDLRLMECPGCDE